MKNTDMTKTAYSMLCALCIALSAAVQSVFPGFGADCAVYFSVFICAVCCPLRYGVFCAVVCPVFSMMTAGEPSAVLLPAGIAKYTVFLLLSKPALRRVHTGRLFTDVYISLVPPLCVGQITDAVICAAVFCADRYSAAAFLIQKLAAAIPETAVLLALIPETAMLLKSLGLADKEI